MIARAAAATFLAAFAVASGHAQERPKIDTSAKAVIAAATAYVAAYEQQMSFVLADELATQRVANLGDDPAGVRRTRAELFLTYLPAEGTWIAVRDVREVDGAPVNDPDDIRSLIERAPLWRLGAVIAEKNSRFNIGNVRRTFNEPTLGLLIVSARHHRRFKFDRAGVTAGASPVVTVRFTERDRPTMITGTNGEPVFTRGDLDIDAATGRVERTRIEMTLGSVRASIATTYAADTKLNMWVPSVMTERYEQASAAFRQTITCEAVYTNYRKFDTTVIIK